MKPNTHHNFTDQQREKFRRELETLRDSAIQACKDVYTHYHFPDSVKVDKQSMKEKLTAIASQLLQIFQKFEHSLHGCMAEAGIPLADIPPFRSCTDKLAWQLDTTIRQIIANTWDNPFTKAIMPNRFLAFLYNLLKKRLTAEEANAHLLSLCDGTEKYLRRYSDACLEALMYHFRGLREKTIQTLASIYLPPSVLGGIVPFDTPIKHR